MSWTLQKGELPIRFLIHDRDAKFPASFDHLFAAEKVMILYTPFGSPQANPFAERWVRSVPEEYLNHIRIVNDGHLHRVLKEYVMYFNQARPHQGIGQQIPASTRCSVQGGPIRCRDVLGGMIHDY